MRLNSDRPPAELVAPTLGDAGCKVAAGDPACCPAGLGHRAQDPACNPARRKQGDGDGEQAADQQPEPELRERRLDGLGRVHEEERWAVALAPPDHQDRLAVQLLPGIRQLAPGDGVAEARVQLLQRAAKPRGLVRGTVPEVGDHLRAPAQPEGFRQPARDQAPRIGRAGVGAGQQDRQVEVDLLAGVGDLAGAQRRVHEGVDAEPDRRDRERHERNERHRQPAPDAHRHACGPRLRHRGARPCSRHHER